MATFLAGNIAGLVKNLAAFFVDLFIVIFALFFMFRDGDSIVRGLRHLLPLDESIQQDMLSESKDLIFASVAVGLIIAGVQGFLGGMAFTIGGIPTRGFLGGADGVFLVGSGGRFGVDLGSGGTCGWDSPGIGVKAR